MDISSTFNVPPSLPPTPSSHAPEETGAVAEEEEEEDQETRPADGVLLGHVGLLLHGLHDRVLVQPGAELGELELESVSHVDKEWERWCCGERKGNDVHVRRGRGVRVLFETRGAGGCFWWNQNKEQEHHVLRPVLPAPRVGRGGRSHTMKPCTRACCWARPCAWGGLIGWAWSKRSGAPGHAWATSTEAQKKGHGAWDTHPGNTDQAEAQMQHSGASYRGGRRRACVDEDLGRGVCFSKRGMASEWKDEHPA